MAMINNGAKPVRLFCKFENVSENPAALEARENPIAYGNLETLSVTQNVLILIRKIYSA